MRVHTLCNSELHDLFLEITILKELLNDILPEGSGPQEVLGALEDEEEQYWVEKLGKMASVDILTLGKIQPATMEIITNLPTNIMYRTVRETLIKVKQLNVEIQRLENKSIPDELQTQLTKWRDEL